MLSTLLLHDERLYSVVDISKFNKPSSQDAFTIVFFFIGIGHKRVDGPSHGKPLLSPIDIRNSEGVTRALEACKHSSEA